MLNLDPPPGFRGLADEIPITVYYRNLPHWRQQGATYFITFNLADALPRAKKALLKSMRREWERHCPPPRDEASWTDYAKTVFRHVEKWMDAGYGKCWFRDETYANELWRSILHFHQARYQIGCFVVMANHCHLVIRPLADTELEGEVGSIKSVTTRFINKRESRSGPLWQQESYDRIVRDEDHLYRVVQYIGRNPRAAGVSLETARRWVNPEWEKRGWGFRDD